MSHHHDTYEVIASDAASLSLSWVSSRSSTVYGIGTVSGHALMRFGEKMLEGMDRVGEWLFAIRLQRIASTIPALDPAEWALSTIMFVLELQR